MFLGIKSIHIMLTYQQRLDLQPSHRLKMTFPDSVCETLKALKGVKTFVEKHNPNQIKLRMKDYITRKLPSRVKGLSRRNLTATTLISANGMVLLWLRVSHWNKSSELTLLTFTSPSWVCLPSLHALLPTDTTSCGHSKTGQGFLCWPGAIQGIVLYL